MKAADAETARRRGAEDGNVGPCTGFLECASGETGIVEESCVTCLILLARIALRGVPRPETERGFFALEGIMDGIIVGGGRSGTSIGIDELAILEPPDKPKRGNFDGEAPYAADKSSTSKSKSTPASCIPSPASPFQ